MRTHPIEHYQALRDSAPCLSRAATLSKGTKLGLGRGAHLGTPSLANHTAGVSQPIGLIAYPETRFRRERARHVYRMLEHMSLCAEPARYTRMYGNHISHTPEYNRVWINRVRFPICSWSAEQGKRIFPCPRSRLKIWSRETGSAVSSRVSLFILHIQAESGAYSGFLPISEATSISLFKPPYP